MKKLLLALSLLPTLLLAQRTWDTIPFVPDHYRAMREMFKKQPVVTEKVMFLGNSITESGNWRKLLKDSSVINLGISGDITFGILARMEDIAKRKPSKLFLMIGINDLAKGIPDEVIMENIFTIVSNVRRTSPKTKIFVQSILPTNNAIPSTPFPNHVNKGDHIITVNGQLEKYAEKLHYTYVDLYSRFLDTDGRLDLKYTADGLHINAAGYTLWVEILKAQKYL